MSINGSDGQINQALLRSVVKINTAMLALSFGLLGGVLLFAVTWMSLLRGLPNPGHYLNLLGVFLPGYNVSATGAWIGFFWGAVVSATLAALVYRIYARSIPDRVSELLERGISDDDDLGSVMIFDGKYLGLALGLVSALGLIVTTNSLVLRGTADESVHARLLVNYLPGYEVSVQGSLIGGLELFVFTYLATILFSWIYNTIVSLRSKSSG